MRMAKPGPLYTRTSCLSAKSSLTKEASQTINFSSDKGIAFTLYLLHDLCVIGCRPGKIHVCKKQILVVAKVSFQFIFFCGGGGGGGGGMRNWCWGTCHL